MVLVIWFSAKIDVITRHIPTTQSSCKTIQVYVFTPDPPPTHTHTHTFLASIIGKSH